MNKSINLFLYFILFSILGLILILKYTQVPEYHLSILWFDPSSLSRDKLIDTVCSLPSKNKKSIYIATLENQLSKDETADIKMKFSKKNIDVLIEDLATISKNNPDSLSLKIAEKYPDLKIKRLLTLWFIPRKASRINIICTETGLLTFKKYSSKFLKNYKDKFMADLVDDVNGFYEQNFNLIVQSMNSENHFSAIKLIEQSLNNNIERLNFIQKKHNQNLIQTKSLVKEKIEFLKNNSNQIISDYYFLDSIAGNDFAKNNSFLFDFHFTKKFTSQYDFSKKINYSKLSYSELECSEISNKDLFLSSIVENDILN